MGGHQLKAGQFFPPRGYEAKYLSPWGTSLVVDEVSRLKLVAQSLTQQPESVSSTLRIFVSLVPVFILLLSFIPVYLYPITKERHAEIRAKLEEQKNV